MESCSCNKCGTTYTEWVYWSFIVRNEWYREIVHIDESSKIILESLYEKYPDDVPEINAGFKCCANKSCGYLTVFVDIGDRRKIIRRQNNVYRN